MNLEIWIPVAYVAGMILRSASLTVERVILPWILKS
jgi:hypothetical protein